MENILPLRQRQEITDSWRVKRLENLLPDLMKQAGLDMWIVVSREDNQDPVLSTLIPPVLTGDEAVVLPPTGNRVILVFYMHPDGKVERFHISSLNLAGYYSKREGEQWETLSRLVDELNPERIGINVSENFAHADGLSATEQRLLLNSLGAYAYRTQSAEKLVVAWLEARLKEELEFYPNIINISNNLIAEAFSNEAVTPGVTSVDDVAWWMRQRIRDLGLTAWFRPMVAINRQGQQQMQFSGTIHPGDMLFCDVGINYLGLLTDSQQQAYVLKPGETQAPHGLRQAMRSCNRLQDILAKEFISGRTGNEILAAALARAQAEGIEAFINTHPVGYFGHGPGAAIGVWDKQDGVPGRGDYPLRDDTCYALELCTRQLIPEWDQWMNMNLEETIIFTGGEVIFSPGRRFEFHLIGPGESSGSNPFNHD